MDKKTLRFSTRHISEFYVTEDQYGMVDTVFRKYEIPARQAVQRFGIENHYPRGVVNYFVMT